jgi:hypothetical protein
VCLYPVTLSLLAICIRLVEQKITAQNQNMIRSHIPFQNKRFWLCFLFLQIIESSTLSYVAFKLDEVYIEFFIGSCSMHNTNRKLKIMVQKTRKVSALAYLRMSIEYRMS